MHDKHHGAGVCGKTPPCVPLGRFGIEVQLGKAGQVDSAGRSFLFEVRWQFKSCGETSSLYFKYDTREVIIRKRSPKWMKSSRRLVLSQTSPVKKTFHLPFVHMSENILA